MVLDTHVFIWFLVGDRSLPTRLKKQMEASPESVLVPSICFWETLMLVEKERLSLGDGDPARLLTELMKQTGFIQSPLTADIAMLSRTLPFLHDDPADRFIGATSVALSQPLATADERLRQLPWLKLA